MDDRTLIYGCNFDLSLNENWLYWATFLAIAVVPFFLGYRVALSRLQISGRIKGWVLLIRGIVPIVLFLIPSLITFPLAGFPGVLDLTYHSWLLYGLVLGLIDAISGMYPDLEFVNSNEYDDAVKIARLQQEHEKWASALADIPQIEPPFLDIAPAGMLPTIISHSKGVKCVLIRSNSSFHGPTTVLPSVKSPNRWSTTKSLPWEALLPCTTR